MSVNAKEMPLFSSKPAILFLDVLLPMEKPHVKPATSWTTFNSILTLKAFASVKPSLSYPTIFVSIFVEMVLWEKESTTIVMMETILEETAAQQIVKYRQAIPAEEAVEQLLPFVSILVFPSLLTRKAQKEAKDKIKESSISIYFLRS